MSRPLLLDLFCGAGGAAMGYYRAGFDVIGVDIKKQPRYPFEFVQGDALNPPVSLSRFDAMHASPPCQSYSQVRAMPWVKARPMLVEPIRNLLIESGKPYVIENVPGAPLINPITLCGLSFNLKVVRHRKFESNQALFSIEHRHHGKLTTNSFRKYSSFATGATHIAVAGHNFSRADGAIAMQIDWPMRREEMAEAIPPAYTEFIGRQLIEHLKNR